MSELTPAPKGYAIKLVRDKTAQILNGSGEPGALWYGPLEGDRMRWLRLKLAEELGEYLVDGGLDELADVLAVMDALAVEHGSDPAGLRTLLESHERGGFFDAVMMYGRHPEFDGQPASAPVQADAGPSAATPSGGAGGAAHEPKAAGPCMSTEEKRATDE